MRGLGECVYMDGVADGRAEGRAEGRAQEIARIVIKKVKKNNDLSTIADAIEEDIEYVRPIYNVVVENSNLDDERIVCILRDRRVL